MNKRKYITPKIDVIHCYDSESDVMYGGGHIESNLSTGSIPNFSNTLSGNINGEDKDNSDRSKETWGNVWDDWDIY